MSLAIVIGIAAVTLLAGLAAGYWLPPHGRKPGREQPKPGRTILLPFTGQAISRRSFEAAVRLARAENATIVPSVPGAGARGTCRSTHRCPPSAPAG